MEELQVPGKMKATRAPETIWNLRGREKFLASDKNRTITFSRPTRNIVTVTAALLPKYQGVQEEQGQKNTTKQVL